MFESGDAKLLATIATQYKYPALLTVSRPTVFLLLSKELYLYFKSCTAVDPQDHSSCTYNPVW